MLIFYPETSELNFSLQGHNGGIFFTFTKWKPLKNINIRTQKLSMTVHKENLELKDLEPGVPPIKFSSQAKTEEGSNLKIDYIKLVKQ